METMEIEKAKVTFTPQGTSDSFSMGDLAHMKIGTEIVGTMVIHGDELEAYDGVIVVQENGVLFVEDEI